MSDEVTNGDAKTLERCVPGHILINLALKFFLCVVGGVGVGVASTSKDMCATNGWKQGFFL
jgi:hypothetical protein